MYWNATTILALRNHLGLKQHLFAIALGVSPSSISGWENGREPLSAHKKCLSALAIKHGFVDVEGGDGEVD